MDKYLVKCYYLITTKGEGGADVMDYITIIVDAIVAFAKNFSINEVVSAFAGINWNGVKDAIITIVEAIEKVL